MEMAHSDGHWYNAKIIQKTGRGASEHRAVVVHYVSFPDSHHAKFTCKMEGVRKQQSRAVLKLEQEATKWDGETAGLNPDGKWDVERILERRGCLPPSLEYSLRAARAAAAALR
jgi:hypothetical protein